MDKKWEYNGIFSIKVMAIGTFIEWSVIQAMIGETNYLARNSNDSTNYMTIVHISNGDLNSRLKVFS